MSLDPERRKKADKVLETMSEGLMSLRKACVEVGVTVPTFLRWVDMDKDLAEQYTRARAGLIENMAEELIDIADEDPGVVSTSGATDSGAVAHQRLRVDTRKWLLSKLAPKRYGDRIEVAGDADAPLVHRITRRIVDPKDPQSGS